MIANGISFSPDGRVMYFADSGTRLIRACDYDLENGTFSNLRVFARTERRACRTARPSMPRDASGVRSTTAGASCATLRMAGSIE